jgi:hypothetical protein
MLQLFLRINSTATDIRGILFVRSAGMGRTLCTGVMPVIFCVELFLNYQTKCNFEDNTLFIIFMFPVPKVILKQLE